MAANIDIHHPPAGGFQNGAWYWDPQAGAARQIWNGSFGAPNVVNNPNQTGYGQPVGSTSSSNSPTNSSPLQAVNSAIQDSAKQLMSDVQQKWGQYTQGNPFSVDKVLADKTTEAKEQVDPYYNQLLGDYLQGVTTKINRGNDDAKDLLSQLTTTTSNYDQQSQSNLQQAVDKANAGYANRGLINSGMALANTGENVASTNADTTQNDTKSALSAKQISNTAARNVEDANAAAKDFTTQNAQQQYTAEQQRAGDLTKEAGQRYISGFASTLPPQLQSAGGFNMLQSLGIYN